MKRKILFIMMFMLLITGCLNSNNEVNNEVNNETNDEDILVNDIDKVVDEKLKNMTIDEKIGQMMIVFYTSSKMDNTLRSALTEVMPGGFIFFKDNITTYHDTLNFIKEIKATSKIPMFISIDQEGGSVQRLLSLQEDVSNIPYMKYVGDINDVNFSKEVGRVIAEELRVFGINMDFAPVIDVYSNPSNTVIGKRSFGSNSDVVSNMGLSLAHGLRENGVIPVFKHFPGHGNTSVDSHEALPILDKSKEELYTLDLIPFKSAIEDNAEMIMIGHLAVPSITGDNTPASLSKKLITGLLKEEMGYSGLVITDALNMKALTNYYSQEEIYVKAIEAGVDILLMPSSSRGALKAVKDALVNGEISEGRIDESVRKILKLKYEKIEKDYNNYLPKEYLNSSEHQEILNRIIVNN